MADRSHRGRTYATGTAAICRPRRRHRRRARGARATCPISLHCWQGDDVGGFENAGEALGGGLAVTGNYPGKARTPDELRSDLDQGAVADPRHAPAQPARHLRRDSAAGGSSATSSAPEHFAGWIDWAKAHGIGLDFNPTFFSHPKAADGFTLAHPDAGDPRSSGSTTAIACRRIGAAIGEALGTPCVTNVWIPDGMKDTPVDRKGPRERLVASLDAIFAEPIDPRAQPRRGRGQAVRPRLGELRRRLARVLSRLRDLAQEAALPRRRPLPPDRDDRRQDLRGAACSCRRSCCTSAAACAGTATTSSLLTDDLDGDRARSWSAATTSTASTSASTSSTPASTASPPG